MRNVEFTKKCNGETLTASLIAAGFTQANPQLGLSGDFFGVSSDEKTTTVHLTDETKKDPTSVVNAHVYVAPPTDEALEEERKASWVNARTTEEKLAVLAEQMGLK